MDADARDRELLAELAKGNVSAIGELYDRHAPLLYPLALRILRRPAEAEDVVHDVFLAAQERATQYVPERGSVTAWLVTMTRNLAVDRLRRRERRGALLHDFGHELQGESPSSPEAQVGAAEDRVRVRRALEALSPIARETLERAFFDGKSYPELAEHFGVPLGTIKSRAARAFAQFREALLGADRESTKDS